MVLLLSGLVALVTLTACSPTPPLTAQQRAHTLYEVIDVRPACEGLRQKLLAPEITTEQYSEYYQESIKSGCLLRHA